MTSSNFVVVNLFLILQFCELVQISPKYNLYITTWNCVEIVFSIWVFFHKHSRFTGQQGNGEGISLTLLYPRACRQEGVRCVTPPIPLPPPTFLKFVVIVTKCVGKISWPNDVGKFGVFYHENRNAGFDQYLVSRNQNNEYLAVKYIRFFTNDIMWCL